MVVGSIGDACDGCLAAAHEAEKGLSVRTFDVELIAVAGKEFRSFDSNGRQGRDEVYKKVKYTGDAAYVANGHPSHSQGVFWAAPRSCTPAQAKQTVNKNDERTRYGKLHR